MTNTGTAGGHFITGKDELGRRFGGTHINDDDPRILQPLLPKQSPNEEGLDNQANPSNQPAAGTPRAGS